MKKFFIIFIIIKTPRKLSDRGNFIGLKSLSSVQFSSVTQLYLTLCNPTEQNAKLPCPASTPGTCSNPCPSSQ